MKSVTAVGKEAAAAQDGDKPAAGAEGEKKEGEEKKAAEEKK